MPGRFANLEFDNQQHAEQPELETRTRHDTRADAAESLLAQAKDAYQWGRFESALRLYTRALQEERRLIPAWVGQVQMLVQLDECHEARLWSDKGLELFRNNGELLAAKAQACARLNDAKSAAACSDASLAAPGASPWRWIVRGEMLLARRQKLAAECFQKAVAEPAADWFDHVVIARIHLYYRRATNALHYLRQALELEPTHGYIWFEMGNCQRALGLLPAAAQSYQRCLELRADYAEAERALGSLSDGSSLFARLRLILGRRRRP
jgi:tetratricopeptide (TPR) repeat protein